MTGLYCSIIWRHCGNVFFQFFEELATETNPGRSQEVKDSQGKQVTDLEPFQAQGLCPRAAAEAPTVQPRGLMTWLVVVGVRWSESTFTFEPTMDDGPWGSKGIEFPRELLSLVPFPEKLLCVGAELQQDHHGWWRPLLRFSSRLDLSH